MIENIHEAARWLEMALRPDPGQERRLLAAVSVLSEKPQLAVLLRSLLADRRSTAAVAAHSFTHPLGFDKLALAMSPSFDYHLRLHVWWPGEQESVEDVHNHRFAFASAVLDGVLDMQTFERADDGLPVQEYESTWSRAVGISTFRHVGNAVLGCTLTSRMPAGTVYCMSARALHRITAARGGISATLFLQGPIMRPWTAIFSDQATRRRPAIARPTMSPRSFGERVAAYLETLEASLAA